MKRMLKALIIALMISPLNAKAMTLEEYIDLIDASIIERVEFLPSGHLQKNKPRYIKKDWEVSVSTHFSVYTYGDNKDLGDLYVSYLEESYKEFSEVKEYNKFTQRINFIIYNSQRDFLETNMIFGLIPEGLGGSTEVFRRKRVVIAFRDSLIGLKRLMRHELSHRFDIELFDPGLDDMIKESVPLWFIEGAAEHYSHKWDASSNLVMRYAYLNNLTASAKDNYWHPFLIYTQGEYVLHYIAERYGKNRKDDVIATIFKNSSEMGFSKAFELATGETREEFDRALKLHIEKTYSQIRPKEDLIDHSHVVVNNSFLLDSRENFSLTRKYDMGRQGLYLNWTNGVDVVSKRVTNDGFLKSLNFRGVSFELAPEFGFQEHGASFVSDTKFVYAVDTGPRDKIVIQNFYFDKKKKKIKLKENKSYSFKELRDIQHPVMISEEEVTFIGRRDNFSELYLYNLKTKDLKQLTKTNRSFRGLTYSPITKSLYTSIENENTNSYDLAAYNMTNGEFYYISETPDNEFDVVSSSISAELMYVSDKGLVHNAYNYNLETKKITQLTDVKVGLFRPRWMGNDGLIFNTLENHQVLVKSAPLKNSAVIKEKVIKKSTETTPSEKAIALAKERFPDQSVMTIFETIVSSDSNQIIFLENKNLSIDKLKKGDHEVVFHWVDLSSNSVSRFSLKEFKRLKDYGNAVILKNYKLLLQQKVTTKEWIEYDDNGQLKKEEVEVLYKRIFIYDLKTNKLKKLSFETWGDGYIPYRISSNRRYIVWVNDDKIHYYDSFTNNEQDYKAEYSDPKDIKFISNHEVLVLGKKWNLTVDSLNLETKEKKYWDVAPKKESFYMDDTLWFPVENSDKAFFLLLREGPPRYTARIFDFKKSTITFEYSEAISVMGSKLKEKKLVIETRNRFGKKRFKEIDLDGNISIKDELIKYNLKNKFISLGNFKRVDPRNIKPKHKLLSRTSELSGFPRPYSANGVATIVFDNGVSGHLMLQAVFLGEVNETALLINTYIQDNKGFANTSFYNFNKGRYYHLNYWNLSSRKHQLKLEASQNIFLHPLLNWDINLEENYMYLKRDMGILDVWRTRLGTTFSYDSRKSDWHGPLSGSALFTKAALGTNDHSKFQAIDFNFDARTYLPITERSGLAFRILGGKSFGPNPTNYMWGGNKTFRGTGFDDQLGDTYILQSSDLRVPLLDVVGTRMSGVMGDIFTPLTVYFDVRGGMYHDIGDIWYSKDNVFGTLKRSYQTQQSAGIFINVPTPFGINFRITHGLWYMKRTTFWLGYNW